MWLKVATILHHNYSFHHQHQSLHKSYHKCTFLYNIIHAQANEHTKRSGNKELRRIRSPILYPFLKVEATLKHKVNLLLTSQIPLPQVFCILRTDSDWSAIIPNFSRTGERSEVWQTWSLSYGRGNGVGGGTKKEYY